MTRRLSALVIALLGGAFVPAHPSPETPPLPGPGGVAMAVQAFLKHQDEGTSAAKLLVDRQHDVDFVIGEDGGLQQFEGAGKTPAFMDVAAGAEGRPVAARKAGEFAALLGADVSANEKAVRSLRTEIKTIRASCDSERSSLAIVEFDRIYLLGPGLEMTVPMRATALLQWQRTEGADFRIYHWHASRAGEVRQMPVGRTQRKQQQDPGK